MRALHVLPKLIVIAALVVSLAWWRETTIAEPGRLSPQLVRDDVPNHALLQDALEIVAQQRAEQEPNFTALPATRPPGLERLGIGGVGDAITDSYRMLSRLYVILAFSAAPLPLCDAPALCLRNGSVADLGVPTQPLVHGRDQEGARDLRHLTIYVTRDAGGVSTSDPDVIQARRYWSTVRFVPMADAAWFTELLATARTSTIKE